MADRPATTQRKRSKAGRKRRVAGWVLLVIGVLIAGVWGASKWWWCRYATPTTFLHVSLGSVEVRACETGWGPLSQQWMGWRLSPVQEDEKTIWWLWHLAPTPFGMETQRSMNAAVFDVNEAIAASGATDRMVRILLWPFALASLLGGGWLVWSGRQSRHRAMSGMCLKCGYDLAGLAAGSLCPECGHAAKVVH